MKHYLHALLAPPAKVGFAQLRAAVADLPLLGGPIQITPSGDYLLVHSDYEQDEIRQTRRNMIAHTRVLETLLPLVTVLPMRFGLLTSDLDAVQKLILVRTEEIVAQAARVANHAEYGLRVSFPRAAPRRITRASISGAASRNCSIDGAARHKKRWSQHSRAKPRQAMCCANPRAMSKSCARSFCSLLTGPMLLPSAPLTSRAAFLSPPKPSRRCS